MIEYIQSKATRFHRRPHWEFVWPSRTSDNLTFHVRTNTVSSITISFVPQTRIGRISHFRRIGLCATGMWHCDLNTGTLSDTLDILQVVCWIGCLWWLWSRCIDLVDYNPIVDQLNGLSGGSIFLIMFVVVMVTYCILGCAYNSFYHGRVGMDAVPNKDTWTDCMRYNKAGWATTRDVLCCSPSAGAYEEL